MTEGGSAAGGGGAGESAVAFHPLRNDAIAAAKPKSETQALQKDQFQLHAKTMSKKEGG
jgi:hypothetical protein